MDLSPTLRADAAGWTEWSQYDGGFTYEGEDQVSTFHPTPWMDFTAWAADVDENGRGWSSTEWRLFQLVASLGVPDRKVALVGVLDALGSWQDDVLRIIVD